LGRSLAASILSPKNNGPDTAAELARRTHGEQVRFLHRSHFQTLLKLLFGDRDVQCDAQNSASVACMEDF